MNWESESLYTERTNTDRFVFVFVLVVFKRTIFIVFSDYQSLAAQNAYRKLYPDDDIPQSPKKKFESRGIGTHSAMSRNNEIYQSFRTFRCFSRFFQNLNTRRQENRIDCRRVVTLKFVQYTKLNHLATRTIVKRRFHKGFCH